MTNKEALIKFYRFNQLDIEEDMDAEFVQIYIGCILAPIPNIQARKKYLRIHDLHHVMTGYGVDRIGESEASAWELGARSCRKPIISLMNLFALSTGFILSPKRVTRAFYRGCRSKNLYYLADSTTAEEFDRMDAQQLTKNHVEIRDRVRYKPFRQIEFFGYIVISMVIHIFMVIAGKMALMSEWLYKRVRKSG